MTIFDEAQQAIVDGDTLDLLPFAANPDPRCAAVLVLDRSYSMSSNDAIGQLNEGLQVLQQELMQDNLAARRIELGIVSFGSDVKVENEVTGLDAFTPPTLVASGSTPMAEAMMSALHLIANKTAIYKEAGIAYYKPWILLITDGCPTDSNEDLDAAVAQLQDAQQNGHVTVFTVGVDQADFATLDRMSHKFSPKKLSGVKWSEFFIWLSNSLKKVSASNPGDKVKMDKSDDWTL